MDTEKLRRQLIDRITENYREYRANLLLKDRQELIDGAGRIADTALVFQPEMCIGSGRFNRRLKYVLT